MVTQPLGNGMILVRFDAPPDSRWAIMTSDAVAAMLRHQAYEHGPHYNTDGIVFELSALGLDGGLPIRLGG